LMLVVRGEHGRAINERGSVLVDDLSGEQGAENKE